jgi:hypothetical protein
MENQEKVREIIQQCIDMIGKSLSNSIAHAITEGYKLGWEEGYLFNNKI